MLNTLFFDLDGTLIDSAIGITRCVQHALRELGEPVPEAEALRGWIGPPLRDSFTPLLGDAQRVERAVELYRERFDAVGWSEHRVYDDIGRCVQQLADAGFELAVVTAKNEPHARRIVDHLPFGNCFRTISGATADGRISHKPQLIEAALQRLDRTPAQCLMIGDRHMDIDGARHHGMYSIGVLWGFGTAAELAHADALAESPARLLSHVEARAASRLAPGTA